MKSKYRYYPTDFITSAVCYRSQTKKRSTASPFKIIYIFFVFFLMIPARIFCVLFKIRFACFFHHKKRKVYSGFRFRWRPFVFIISKRIYMRFLPGCYNNFLRFYQGCSRIFQMCAAWLCWKLLFLRKNGTFFAFSFLP